VRRTARGSGELALPVAAERLVVLVGTRGKDDAIEKWLMAALPRRSTNTPPSGEGR